MNVKGVEKRWKTSRMNDYEEVMEKVEEYWSVGRHENKSGSENEILFALLRIKSRVTIRVLLSWKIIYTKH